MTKILNSIKAFVRSLITYEPAVVTGVVVAVIGAVAGALGIVVDTATTSQIAAYVIAVLGGSLAVRQAVTPNAKVVLANARVLAKAYAPPTKTGPAVVDPTLPPPTHVTPDPPK